MMDKIARIEVMADDVRYMAQCIYMAQQAKAIDEKRLKAMLAYFLDKFNNA